MSATDPSPTTIPPADGGVDRVRRLLRGFVDLRHDPRPAVRLAWWGGWIVLLCLALRSGPLRQPILGLWVAANLGVLAVAEVWGLFHVRAMWRAQGTALRWSFGMAWLLTLAVAGATESSLETVGIARLAILAQLVVFLAITAVVYPLGFSGACLSAIFRRVGEAPDVAASRGIVGWWLALGLLWIGYEAAEPIFTQVASSLGTVAYACSWPALTLLLARLQAQPALDPPAVARRIGSWMARRLLVEVRLAGRSHRLDLRGALLGLIAALLAAIASLCGLLDTPRSAALAQMVQTRGALLRRSSLGPDQRGTEHASAIVLLQLDAAAQRLIRTEQSEAAVQAHVIAKLSSWGVSAIVVPVPLGAAPQVADALREADQDNSLPLPGDADAERSTRDLPRLAEAMAASGRTYLAVSANPSLQRPFGRLSAAAKATANADLANLGLRLPALDVRSADDLPLPVVLYCAATGRPETVEVGRRYAKIGGERFATIRPGAILVDYNTSRPGSRFRRVGYSQVLREETIFQGGRPRGGLSVSVPLGDEAALAVTDDAPRPPVRPLHPADPAPVPETTSASWVPPSEFFRDKVVFLDSLAPRTHETPLGRMRTAELLAHATSTLLDGKTIASVPATATWLWTLLLAVCVGQFSLRRDALNATWRLAVVSLLFVVVALLRFYTAAYFADPVLPLFAAALSALLVVQLTMVIERGERARNLALLQRFVAPQVVDELLEDPEGRLGLGGTRQEVCVLFADVRGFTPFSERHTPEQVIDVINAYMTAMTIALHQHGGLLDKYTGDGLMAIFRVGADRRQDLLRAVRAGLDMRKAARAISDELERQGKDPLDIGLGLHCGEAVVGLVGSANQFNYTALGYTVAVTQRLESLAAGGEILISDALYHEVADHVVAAAGGPVRVKGITEPIKPYGVVALKAPETEPTDESDIPAVDLPL